MLKLNSWKIKKAVSIALVIIAGLVFIVSILLFAFRNLILQKVIDHKLYAFEQQYNVDLNYKVAKFSGVSTVNLYHLDLTPVRKDTLLKVDTLSVSIKPIDLLFNRLRIRQLYMASTEISLSRKDSLSNYLFLLEKKKKSTLTDTTSLGVSKNYSERISLIMNAIFNHIPASTIINDFRIKANIDTSTFSFAMPSLYIKNRNFNTSATVTDDTVTNIWNISGHLDPVEKDIKISIKAAEKSKIRIPYIEKRWKTYFAFDSAAMEFSYSKKINDISRFEGYAFIAGPVLNHPRISPDDVKLEQSKISFAVNVGQSFVEVDSSTFVSFNETGFHPYIMYILQPSKLLTFRINEPSFDAQSFFNSLPAGLFYNLEGIKVKGTLSFNLNFEIAFNQPDSLIFDAKLRSKNFAVERFGNTNFNYINDPFIYTAYENGRPVREIIVGEANPNFRAITEIPEHLKQAIMTSEDGQFFYHNGFIPDAIRHSLITNIKEKRFARGGSTISMQLVKNVFLNRNKNITRKLEEMLITWIIESRRMVSKERMLEVYLNIIETGPMVYGVNEAAQFYFRKDVSKLTLAESIYLASIVPRPKLFKYSFDKEGNLREYLTSYYELVSGKMLNRGWITQEEYDNLKPEITLRGPARNYIITDTIPEDDVLIKERKSIFDFLKFDIFKRKKRE